MAINIFDNKTKSFLFENFKKQADGEETVKKNIEDGNNLYNDLINKYGNVDEMSDEEIEKVKKVLIVLKRNRNKIGNIVNNSIRLINNIKKIIETISTIITISRIIIRVLTSLPVPAKFLTAGIIVGFSNKVQKADRKIESLDITISNVKPFISKILEILLRIQALLKILDQIIALIEAFLAKRNKNFKTEVLNQNIEDIKLQQQLLNITQENNNVIGFHKGFRFELREEYNPQFQIGDIKRKYAVAIDTRGIEKIKSDYSFASNPDVLVDELKYIIDRDEIIA